jgi:hypothetical protein
MDMSTLARKSPSCPVAASTHINFLGLASTIKGNVHLDEDINHTSERIFTQEHVNILKRPFAALLQQ